MPPLALRATQPGARMPDEVLTIKEVAALLKLAEKTVHAMAPVRPTPRCTGGHTTKAAREARATLARSSSSSVLRKTERSAEPTATTRATSPPTWTPSARLSLKAAVGPDAGAPAGLEGRARHHAPATTGGGGGAGTGEAPR
jgi:hypothetical protein